ncbi:hypothetical protein BDB00DRAFT_773030 [Zychaea mexicana]|uniref:uncharacterized protein n=1 Tax=Zychaea mexicana TaxID=64656 RepID=UPI0022FEED0B|nr:uncharacterized protein BDB00DRAFT_773030 [Zychaea mexicana]KAI9488185.1 hypothetical protein BDB00DRAFT_773030 [Zychaea mexicana]
MTNKQESLINNYCNTNLENIDDNMYIEEDNDIDEDSFEVEKILNHRKFKKRMKFIVKWRDYDDSYNEWIWQENFNDTTIIDNYLKSLTN